MAGLAGKKLLIMGANPETVPLVEAARRLGVQTAVTDYLPGSFAKKYADEAYDVDGFDVDGLVELARDIGADGVLVGVADRLIVPYQQVCERLGFPCYATRRQCEVLTDKERFAQEAARFGILSIPRYDVCDDDYEERLSEFDYPVLVKPPDGNSGKGVTVCHRPDDVPGAVALAKENSQTGRFLIERFMQCDDVLIYYTFVGSECTVSVMADRYTHRENFTGSPVCIGDVSPSIHLSEYLENEHSKMRALFSDLEMRDCILLVSAFVEDGCFYYYDPGFRLQGSAPNLTVAEMTGVDHLEMLVTYALTRANPYAGAPAASMGCNDWDECAATIWFLLKSGMIGAIDGLEGLSDDPSVYANVVRFNSGDVVAEGDLGTERQVLARTYVKAPSIDSLAEKVAFLRSEVRILGADGNDMVLDALGPRCFEKRLEAGEAL